MTHVGHSAVSTKLDNDRLTQAFVDADRGGLVLDCAVEVFVTVETRYILHLSKKLPKR